MIYPSTFENFVLSSMFRVSLERPLKSSQIYKGKVPISVASYFTAEINLRHFDFYILLKDEKVKLSYPSPRIHISPDVHLFITLRPS